MDDTYDEALNDLKDRYSNDQVLFTAFMRKFMNLPTYSQRESAAELKSLHDSARAYVVQLKNLKFNTEANSEFFAFHLLEKLSPATRLDFERYRKEPKTVAKLQQLLDFLKSTFLIADAAVHASHHNNSKASLNAKANNISTKPVNRREIRNLHVAKKSIICPIEGCKGSHVLRKCQQFLQWTPFERKSFASTHKLCFNCLGHSTSTPCSSKHSCFTCGGRHHTLLHFNHSKLSSNTTSLRDPEPLSNSPHVNHAPLVNPQMVSNNLVHTSSTILLATAIVNVIDASGQPVRLRALIDNGSQQSVITTRVVQRLKLPFIPFCIGYRPMGESQYKIADKGVILSIQSIVNPNFNFKTKFAVLPSITSELPLHPVKVKSWPHLKNLSLADPHYATPGQIDLLLAGDVYGRILESGVCKGEIGDPIAQCTALGWILFGELFQQNHVLTFPLTQCNHISTTEIRDLLTRFYELEEVPIVRSISKEDEWTERFYQETTLRQRNGKFMVRLPFKSYLDPSTALGSSYEVALQRFQSLQRRFSRDDKFKEAYFKVFNEYQKLNQVKLMHQIQEKHYYLPHHAVFKETSLTTKLRQVFDGSAKSTNGKSLNDIWTTGPVLQANLVSIILNWRTHKYAFIADIEKMYRCIDMHPDDTHYQYILWQDDDNSGIQTYALQTVTFGLAPSPYQAIKTLHVLAEEAKLTSPAVYSALKFETYVDDVTTGSETIEDAIQMIQELIKLLRSAGFELRKWASNSPEILKQIPVEYRDETTMCLFNPEDSIKALGLGWSRLSDFFTFSMKFPTATRLTKRNVSSIVARLFDPLGWLNLFVTKEKIFLNKLWEQKLDWDEPITCINLQSEFNQTMDDLQLIKYIEIPRWIHTSSTNKNNQLHVFCDSSTNAYATAIYLRTVDVNGYVYDNLLAAKSKLAPIRKPLTIPRAELCGATLAVTLLDAVKQSLRLNIDKVFMWTDSTVVLSWIRGDPNRWAVFVCNRVHKILASTEVEQWNHVSSSANPADLNSRGLTITELRDSSLWWHGPPFLSLSQAEWPNSSYELHDDDDSELGDRFKSINLTTKEEGGLEPLLKRFSNFNRLRRAVAYAIRFVKIMRSSINLTRQRPSIAMLSNPISHLIQHIPPPTVIEIQHSELSLIRWIQSTEFSSELKTVHTKKPIPKSSKLFRLNPFIDDNNILRANGRLQNAFMSFEEKFPIILPSTSHLATLIVYHYHRLTLHGGPQVTVNQIRQIYWILDVRNLARRLIRSCVICFRARPVLSQQQMAALPTVRVNHNTRPFASTIIDYAGPYDIRSSRGRGQKSYKGYVAVFTCMTTKAVHLEAAGDLSTQTFLHAFDRFVARRGFCHDVFSDCGTNFVGADHENQRSQSQYLRSIAKEIIPALTNRHIQWHFSPPGAPHFNGLAEAAVKSMKFHLARVIGKAKLTFEEFSTVLTRIEAVLNSRPISPITDNPNDFTAITPGHFLTGNALLSRPQPPCESNPIKRHQLMDQMVQHFWQRFKEDILSTMQIRTKWQERKPNIKENDLVIIKDDRFPVGQWPMGRVVSLHPESDELIRVVTIKTATGTFKRPITKLALVPIVAH
ncbi:uncharacterized protein [Eurosta solidaginis]|uniref:uncharacterized protein n=1 Tax=Eurosta solidaginis TaxID=178769 RepID=UPI0035312C21